MHDFTLSPPDCTPAASYLDTDCGTEPGALALFIAWNVISESALAHAETDSTDSPRCFAGMYLFLNMFTGTVVENFS